MHYRDTTMEDIIGDPTGDTIEWDNVTGDVDGMGHDVM